jgi:hypothetical protein
MNDGRLHRQDSAPGDQAIHGRNPRREIMQDLVGQDSQECEFPARHAAARSRLSNHRGERVAPRLGSAHSLERARKSRRLLSTMVPSRTCPAARAEATRCPGARPPASLPSEIYRKVLLEMERHRYPEPLARFPRAARSKQSWRLREASRHDGFLPCSVEARFGLVLQEALQHPFVQARWE